MISEEKNLNNEICEICYEDFLSVVKSEGYDGYDDYLKKNNYDEWVELKKVCEENGYVNIDELIKFNKELFFVEVEENMNDNLMKLIEEDYSDENCVGKEVM